MKSTGKFSCAFKIALIICCFIGILSNILTTTSIQSILSFYTIQSNILVLIFYLVSFVIKHFKSNWEFTKVYHLLKGATLMVIFLTILIYSISLNPSGFTMDINHSSSSIFEISNLFVHFITPIMVILDYFLFDEKGKFKKYYPFIWYIFPLSYLAYVYIYASWDGKFFSTGGSIKYGYFFLDIDKIGIFGVLKYVFIISIVFIIVSYLFILLDKFLEAHQKRQLTCKIWLK